jgi:hypothetical protein
MWAADAVGGGAQESIGLALEPPALGCAGPGYWSFCVEFLFDRV